MALKLQFLFSVNKMKLYCLGAKRTGKELFATVSGYDRAKNLHQDQELPGLIISVYCSFVED